MLARRGPAMVAQFRERPRVRLQPRVSKPSTGRLPSVSSWVVMLDRRRIVFYGMSCLGSSCIAVPCRYFGLAVEGSV